MKQITPEDLMSQAPDASREMASHLRVGVLSLPGVEEACYADEAEGTYSVAFTLDGDPVLQGHMENPLRVTLEMNEGEARTILDRPDLAQTEFQPEGTTARRPLGELVEAERGGQGPVRINLILTSQEDLRAAVRLAHAKYDAIVTG